MNYCNYPCFFPVSFNYSVKDNKKIGIMKNKILEYLSRALIGYQYKVIKQTELLEKKIFYMVYTRILLYMFLKKYKTYSILFRREHFNI